MLLIKDGTLSNRESKLGTTCGREASKRCCPGVKREAADSNDYLLQWSAGSPRRSSDHRRPAKCTEGSNVDRGSDATAGSSFDRPAGARN
jgi:hypothetical protein